MTQQLTLSEIQPQIQVFEPAITAPLTVAEYFAGIGLVRLGLEQAGWEIVFANDFDPRKQEMYESYFSDGEGHYDPRNIDHLKMSEVPVTTLATSSFPCIDLSLAGNRNGLEGEHSSAFWGFTKILEKQGNDKPPLVMLENVPGWLTSNKGNDFRITIEALNDLGYACDVYSLDALRFTPQSRLRIFVVGVQSQKPNNDINKLFGRPDSLAFTKLKKTIQENEDMVWHILDVPAPPPLRDGGLADEVIEKMTEDDPRWWSKDQVSRHLDMMAYEHRKRVEAMRHKFEWSYRTVYRRRRNGHQRAEVRKGDIAGCLRTARGGSSRQIVIVAGYGEVGMRHMTPREYARLQGVPDDYPLPLNTIQALTGFGDAVCVDVIEWIAKNILNQIVAKHFGDWDLG